MPALFAMNSGDKDPSRWRWSSTLGQALALATSKAGNLDRSAWKEAAIRRRLSASVWYSVNWKIWKQLLNKVLSSPYRALGSTNHTNRIPPKRLAKHTQETNIYVWKSMLTQYIYQYTLICYIVLIFLILRKLLTPLSWSNNRRKY